jgi:hypothetical protein
VPVLELTRFIWASPLDHHAGIATYSQTTLEQAEAIVQAAICWSVGSLKSRS